LAAKFRKDEVLLDRADKHYIVLHYDRDGQQLNYLQRQASFLRLRDGARDSTSEADLVALLCLVFAHQDRNQIARRPEVKPTIMFRDFRNGQVVLSDSFLIYPELFPKPLPGAAVRITAGWQHGGL